MFSLRFCYDWCWRTLLATFLLFPALALAHEGHDHGAPPPVLNIPLAPRFAVEGETVEVVGVLQGAILRLYVDNFADNAPISGAKLELESEGNQLGQGVAHETAPGVYDFSLPTAQALAPGNYPLTLTLSLPLTLNTEQGEQFDLLAAVLRVPEAAAMNTAEGNTPGRVMFFGGLGGYLLIIGIGIGVGFGLLLFLRQKNKNKSLLNSPTNR